MTNLSYFLTYCVLGLILLTLLIIAQVSQRTCPSSRYYRLLCASLLFWVACNGAMHIVKDLDAAKFFHELKFIGVATSPVFLLLFIGQITRVSRWIDRTAIALFFLIPGITIVLALTNHYHHMFRQSVEILTTDPLRIIPQNSLWFVVHTSYSYLLMLTGIGMSLWAFGRTSAEKRMPLWVLVIASGSAIVSNAVTIFLLGDLPLDSSLASNVVILPFLHWAMVAASRNNCTSLAREELFSSIGNPIFVLDSLRRISEMNQPAQELCEALHIANTREVALDRRITDFLTKHGATVVDGRLENEHDILLTIQGEQRAYSVSERDFYDSHGAVTGTFVTLTDITNIRQLIHRLEREAGVDPLTGLLNRNEFEHSLKRFDVPENFPISVIMGDTNNLKTVNDTYGHEEGDNMLRSIGDILARCAPSGAVVARIGGDEFILLMRKTPHPQALSVTDRIRTAVLRHKGPSYRLSIALGCATKTSASQDLRQIIEMADRQMYRDKRNE